MKINDKYYLIAKSGRHLLTLEDGQIIPRQLKSIVTQELMDRATVEAEIIISVHDENGKMLIGNMVFDGALKMLDGTELGGLNSLALNNFFKDDMDYVTATIQVEAELVDSIPFADSKVII